MKIKAAAMLMTLILTAGSFTACAEKTNGRSNLAIYLKLVIMTLTSPMAIVGYASIYASIKNASNSILSILFGSALASLSGHTAVVSMWSLIGKKINNKGYLLII